MQPSLSLFLSSLGWDSTKRGLLSWERARERARKGAGGWDGEIYLSNKKPAAWVLGLLGRRERKKGDMKALEALEGLFRGSIWYSRFYFLLSLCVGWFLMLAGRVSPLSVSTTIPYLNTYYLTTCISCIYRRPPSTTAVFQYFCLHLLLSCALRVCWTVTGRGLGLVREFSG